MLVGNRETELSDEKLKRKNCTVEIRKVCFWGAMNRVVCWGEGSSRKREL